MMEQRLAAVPLFQQLSQDKLLQLAERTRSRRLSRGEMLFQKGDLTHALFLVVKGQIKLAFPSAHGNEKVMDVMCPNQWFGEVALLTRSPHSVFAQAMVDSVVLAVGKESVLELLDDDPAFARHMLSNLALRAQALIDDVETYTQRSGAQRVVSFLKQHCPLDQDDNNAIAITLSTSKHVMASRLNLTPETLSRIFHDLTEAQLISVDGRRITIKNPGLLRDFDA